MPMRRALRSWLGLAACAAILVACASGRPNAAASPEAETAPFDPAVHSRLLDERGAWDRMSTHGAISTLAGLGVLGKGGSVRMASNAQILDVASVDAAKSRNAVLWARRLGVRHTGDTITAVAGLPGQIPLEYELSDVAFLVARFHSRQAGVELLELRAIHTATRSNGTESYAVWARPLCENGPTGRVDFLTHAPCSIKGNIGAILSKAHAAYESGALTPEFRPLDLPAR